MVVEEGVDLRSCKAAEDERLPVVLSPTVERPHSDSREVSAVRLLWLEMEV